MTKRWILTPLTILGLLTVGCDSNDDPGPSQSGTSEQADDDEDSDEDDDTPSDTDPGQTSMDPDPDSDTDPDPDSDTDPLPDSDTDCSFLCDDTDDIGNGECDLWSQDCAMEGDRCVPWANDGGNSWNSSRCSPTDANPGQTGDPCTVEGSGVSGIDSCDEGLMCWNSDEENNGVCVSLCQGTQDNPVCDDPSTACIIANDGFLPLCLPTCDPLLQDCGNDTQACYPGDNGFVCAPDASGPELGGFGDPCEFTNACDSSLLCVGAAAFPSCDSTRCCTDFCDLDEAEPSAGCGGVAGGQECVAFFPEGSAPPNLGHVGFCAIPE